jgi:hypothetical protein
MKARKDFGIIQSLWNMLSQGIVLWAEYLGLPPKSYVEILSP